MPRVALKSCTSKRADARRGAQHLSGYEQYFAMARGTKGAEALDMSKFFDTNYHYLVPELAASVAPKPDFSTFIAKARALALAPPSAGPLCCARAGFKEPAGLLDALPSQAFCGT